MVASSNLKKFKKGDKKKMKRKISLILVLLFIMVSLSVFTANAEIETSSSASVDVMSNYMWRGIKLSNATVVQPSVGMTYGAFGANLWANWDNGCTLSTCNNNGELTETDLTLNYTFSIDKLSLDIGYIYYGLEAAGDTQEAYVSAGYDVLLSPSLTIYHDFEEGQGAFIVASIGHSVDLTKDIALNLGASASYNIDNLVMGTDVNGDKISDLYNGDVSASVSIPVTEAISAEPVIAYSFPLSDDAEYAIEAMSDDAESDVVYGGINVTLSF